MRDRDALISATADPGYTPSARELAGLLALLGDDEAARGALRALLRVPLLACDAALAAFDGSDGAARARVCELIGRLARSDEPGLAARRDALASWLSARLHDADGLTRRRAAAALGKLEDPAHESSLCEAWTRAPSAEERRVIAAALGQSGAEAALSLLAGVDASGDPELARIVGEAQLKLTRELARREASVIDLDAVLPDAIEVTLVVRRGFEAILHDELAALGITRVLVRKGGPTVVRTAGPLRALFEARVFMLLSIALPMSPGRGRGSVEDTVVRALAGEPAQSILHGLTRGPVRWRLAWKRGGHHRAATFRVAAALAELCPELVNDPREAPWQVSVDDRDGRVAIELVPRIDDPRFTWRTGAVPASSHPTVAAALARVAGVEADDIVWDPFVGAGAELVERARLGPYRALFGTDLDAAALAVAGDNLRAAGVERCTLLHADAREVRLPRRPTLILTNPPMGHRVVGDVPPAELLHAALDHWCSMLDERGRIVWLSPAPQVTAEHPGVRVQSRAKVDLGGLAAELQVLRPRGRAR
ncbi:MAG: hypothetical protein IPK74_11120 [Deltaproteobacteria bacterium]|nr:hypothetical protein [Deltaproteobacteria bacterium]